MPEGPEVRRNADMLKNQLQGGVLREVRVTSGKLMREWASVSVKLPAKVEEVRVRGKRIVIDLDSGESFTSTLGMSGWWYPGRENAVTTDELGEELVAYYQGRTVTYGEVLDKAYKHTRVELVTADGVAAAYTDPRNFGQFKLTSRAKADEWLAELGLDLLAEQLDDVEELFTQHAKKFGRLRLGDYALEQSALAGLGNIYRAEALYLAKLSPHRKVESLSIVDFKTFLSAAHFVLKIGYKTSGGFRPLVYGQVEDIYGNKVLRDVEFNRSMWWCPAVQS